VRAQPGHGAPTWRRAARRRARERRCSKPFRLALFKLSFLQKFNRSAPNFEYQVVEQGTLSIIAKIDRGFTQGIEQERHANSGFFSAPMNSKPSPWLAMFTTLHSKLAMPLNIKVVCLKILHIFPLGDFEVFTLQTSNATQHQSCVP
jgi:hypothetical protein